MFSDILYLWKVIGSWRYYAHQEIHSLKSSAAEYAKKKFFFTKCNGTCL